MTAGYINNKTTIEKIQSELKANTDISPVLSSSIELLIVVIQMLVDRQSMNSSNSSLPHATDQRKRSRAKNKKKRNRKGNKSVGAQSGAWGTILTQYEDPYEIIQLSSTAKNILDMIPREKSVGYVRLEVNGKNKNGTKKYKISLLKRILFLR